jgi:hypothetical protein
VTITVLPHINFDICKSIFLSKLSDKNVLPQVAEFNTFQGVSVIVNSKYCSLDELDNKIIVAEQKAINFLYLAVNKFYIYSTVDLPKSNKDYDSLLVEHCYNLVRNRFTLVNSTVRTDDHGQLGNFIHPVTTLLLKRYA